MNVNELMHKLLAAKPSAGMRLFVDWHALPQISAVSLLNDRQVILLSEERDDMQMNPPEGFLNNHWNIVATAGELLRMLPRAVQNREVQIKLKYGASHICVSIADVSLENSDGNLVFGIAELPPELHALDYKDD